LLVVIPPLPGGTGDKSMVLVALDSRSPGESILSRLRKQKMKSISNHFTLKNNEAATYQINGKSSQKLKTNGVSNWKRL
jgi:hypothetical protein